MQKAAESLPLTAYGIAFPTRTAKEKVPEIKATVIVYAEASASLRKDEFFPTRRRRFVCAETWHIVYCDRADAPEIPQIFASENIAYISDIHVIIFAYVIDF